MKVRFKSVLVAGSVALDQSWSRVSYDMGSVRDHEHEFRVQTHPTFFWWWPFSSFGCGIPIAMLAVGIGVLTVMVSDVIPDDLIKPRVLLIAGGVVLALSLAAGWWMGSDKVIELQMEKAARVDRGLPENVQLKVVREADWDSFVKNLRAH